MYSVMQKNNSKLLVVSDGGSPVEQRQAGDVLTNKMPKSPNLSPKSPNLNNKNINLFKEDELNKKQAPQMPCAKGVQYARAMAWGTQKMAELIRDPLGRQLFRCFLHESLAEENLLFVEAIENLMAEKGAEPDKVRSGIREILEKYGLYLNLSGCAMKKLCEASKSKSPDKASLEMAHKEIYKLLENDQLPRFRRSEMYQEFVKNLLPS